MSLETQVAGLVTATNSLTGTVNTKIADIDNKVNTVVDKFNDTDLPAMQVEAARATSNLGVNAGGSIEIIRYTQKLLTDHNGDLTGGFWTKSATDPMKSTWRKYGERTPSYGYFYPTAGKTTMLECSGHYSGSDGHYETPQYTNTWVRGHFEFCIANYTATSDQIDAALVASGETNSKNTEGWWNGPEIFPIPSARVPGLHNYSELFYRYVNVAYHEPVGTTPAQMGVDVMSSTCNFSVAKITHYRAFNYND